MIIGLASAVGCGGDDHDGLALQPSDAGAEAGLDAAAPHLDAAPGIEPPPCSGELPVMRARDLQTYEYLDPDWSCYDEPNAQPDGGLTSRSVTFRMTEFPFIVEGVTVDFFFGASTLGMAAVTRVVEPDAGAVTFDAPAMATTLCARVHARPNAGNPAFSILETHEYGLSIPIDGAPIQGATFVRDTRAITVSHVLDGVEEDPDKALLVANISDCGGRPVTGARFELIDDETSLPVPTGSEPRATRASYMYFAIPNASCTFTTNDQQTSTWVMANAPINVAGGSRTATYRLRASGRMRETDSEPVVIDEWEVELFAGGTTMVGSRTAR